MKFYNDFNSMFNAQSGVKSNVCAFNDYTAVMNALNWHSITKNEAFNCILDEAMEYVVDYVKDNYIEIPDATSLDDWYKKVSALTEERMCDIMMFVAQDLIGDDVEGFLSFCVRNNIVPDSFWDFGIKTQEDFDAFYLKYCKGGDCGLSDEDIENCVESALENIPELFTKFRGRVMSDATKLNSLKRSN